MNKNDNYHRILPIKKSIDLYINEIFKYNEKINIVSRKIERNDLYQLINESLILEEYIQTDTIVDAGSGNGLLGYPIFFKKPNRNVFLIESKTKKTEFLNKVKKVFDLRGVNIFNGRVEDFFKHHSPQRTTVVSRGFPNLKILFDLLIKNDEILNVLVITSRNKIKKIDLPLEMIQKKIYNIPFRDNLIILQLEKVSRET